MNRAINARDLNALYVAGPGHGGPGLVANTYLEGTYSEVYPHISDSCAPCGAYPERMKMVLAALVDVGSAWCHRARISVRRESLGYPELLP
jgi:hypothetical protein